MRIAATLIDSGVTQWVARETLLRDPIREEIARDPIREEILHRPHLDLLLYSSLVASVSTHVPLNTHHTGLHFLSCHGIKLSPMHVFVSITVPHIS